MIAVTVSLGWAVLIAAGAEFVLRYAQRLEAENERLRGLIREYVEAEEAASWGLSRIAYDALKAEADAGVTP